MRSTSPHSSVAGASIVTTARLRRQDGAEQLDLSLAGGFGRPREDGQARQQQRDVLDEAGVGMARRGRQLGDRQTGGAQRGRQQAVLGLRQRHVDGRLAGLLAQRVLERRVGRPDVDVLLVQPSRLLG